MKLHERIREFCNGRADCQNIPWMFPTTIREMSRIVDNLEELEVAKAQLTAALAVVEAARDCDKQWDEDEKAGHGISSAYCDYVAILGREIRALDAGGEGEGQMKTTISHQFLIGDKVRHKAGGCGQTMVVGILVEEEGYIGYMCRGGYSPTMHMFKEMELELWDEKK